MPRTESRPTWTYILQRIKPYCRVVRGCGAKYGIRERYKLSWEHVMVCRRCKTKLDMYSGLVRHVNPWQDGRLAGQSFRDGVQPRWTGNGLDGTYTITAARRRIVGDWPRLSAHDCVRLFVQQSSARSGAHLDSMTYAHLVPRACACAVAGSGAGAGACLLQKPCCFLFSYKNKRRPLLHAHILSHNHINTLSTTTPPPKHSSPTKPTPTPINMPTYIVSLNFLRPYQNQS